jgi:hypothetical protein
MKKGTVFLLKKEKIFYELDYHLQLGSAHSVHKRRIRGPVSCAGLIEDTF